jgi:hypothetical protein
MAAITIKQGNEVDHRHLATEPRDEGKVLNKNNVM